MFISPAYLIIAGLVFVYLLSRTFKKTVHVPEYVYIDKSGIVENPTKNYIDVRSNKTINFLLDKEVIHIPHFKWMDGVKHINKMAVLWTQLSNDASKQTDNKTDDLQAQLQYALSYNAIVSLIYELAKPHAKSKRRLKKELWAKSREDVSLIIGICNEILDHWRGLGKLMSLLGKGMTARSTGGEQYTWKTYEVDKAGNLLIKPRFVNFMNSRESLTVKPSNN